MDNNIIISWILSGGVILLFIIAWFLQPQGWWRIVKYIKGTSNNAENDHNEDSPVISVIAFSNGDTEAIDSWLRAIASQDYDKKEAMVVILGTKRQADALSETYAPLPWVKFSFIPPDNHNVSLRKLAYTLGVKGTTGEIIVTSDVYCRPISNSWLSILVEDFSNNNIDMVLGYSQLSMLGVKGKLRRWWCGMDAFVRSLRWMAWAINGKAYRGDGCNLAFRRIAFEQQGGYQNSYFLHPGDDDLFVSDMAKRGSYYVELRKEAQVVVECGSDTIRRWVDKKETASFMNRYLRKSPATLSCIFTIITYLATLLATCVIIYSRIDWPTLCVAMALILFLSSIVWAYRRVARSFMPGLPVWGIWAYIYLKPLCDMAFHIKYHSRKKRNFTWQK